MKEFIIIIESIKDKKLESSIVLKRKHEMLENETIDYVAERYYEEVVDEYDLYDSDTVYVGALEK